MADFFSVKGTSSGANELPRREDNVNLKLGMSICDASTAEHGPEIETKRSVSDILRD
jgi:hypothetical protein